VLKCSAAYLAGQSDDLAGAVGARGATAIPSDTARQPDAVMALRIIDELLAAGHIEPEGSRQTGSQSNCCRIGNANLVASGDMGESKLHSLTCY
jgi:hypothetical protein